MGDYGKPFTDLLGSKAIQKDSGSAVELLEKRGHCRGSIPPSNTAPSQPTAESWGCCLDSDPHVVVSLETSDTGSEATSDSVRKEILGAHGTPPPTFDSKLVLIYFPNTQLWKTRGDAVEEVGSVFNTVVLSLSLSCVWACSCSLNTKGLGKLLSETEPCYYPEIFGLYYPMILCMNLKCHCPREQEGRLLNCMGKRETKPELYLCGCFRPQLCCLT